MAERLLDPRSESATRASSRAAAAPTYRPDPMQEAIACLAEAGERLRPGAPSHPDEVLTLLKEAALRLEEAAIRKTKDGPAG